MIDLFTPDWRDVWGGAEDSAAVGAVYTKPEIVELILDLVGYRHEATDLSSLRLLEPSCGDGVFLGAAVARLIRSVRHHHDEVDWHAPALESAITAVDLSKDAVESARALVRDVLVSEKCPVDRAAALACRWAVQGDFLLLPVDGQYSVVVGNPPYVRIEDLPKGVLAEYRRCFATLRDRADLYIAFFERGLELLASTGSLAFICANRFAKNQYGAGLRQLIARRYRVRQYINLEHTQPFVSDVSAYPAIVVLDRNVGGETRAGELTELDAETLLTVRAQAVDDTQLNGPLHRFERWYPDGAPWSSTSPANVRLLTKLSRDFPVIEESGAGTRIGIGVATGADAVFVLPAKSELVEEARQIPLAMASDVSVDGVGWSGRYLVNPFADTDDGELANLEAYPGLAEYLRAHEGQLRGRHVAKSRPARWYRTIDRVWPQLASTPKLLMPDIQQGGVVGYDSGRVYPHHNLYWITSDEWDLLALQAILRSTQVLTQVRAFSVQMRGGSVRYQAQTLRRIRIPAAASLSRSLVERLRVAATSPCQTTIDEVVSGAYCAPSKPSRH